MNKEINLAFWPSLFITNAYIFQPVNFARKQNLVEYMNKEIYQNLVDHKVDIIGEHFIFY